MGIEVHMSSDYNFVKISNGNEGSLSQQMSQTVHDAHVMKYRLDEQVSTKREASNKDIMIIYPSVPGTKII